MAYLFGEQLANDESLLNLDLIIKYLKYPVIKPRYRLNVLNEDETVNYTIPDEDIQEGGISFTEQYQNGQRKNLTIDLINTDGKYTPAVNGIWLDTKFSYEIGLVMGKNIQWFPRGTYIMGDVSAVNNDAERTISIQLKDKFAIFEGKMGTLESAYEIEVDSNIEDAIRTLINVATGNGTILDPKSIILDPSFLGLRTQSTIRIEEGGTLSQVIEQLATQLSAEYYYNNLGNLCFYPINETIDDSNKPIIWTYEDLDRDMTGLNSSYKNDEVVNVIKVVGDNFGGRIYSAVVTNENPASPICIQRIGRRIAPKYQEPNIWSDELAYDLARYYLRKSSFVSVDFNTTVSFNPLLAVNNICEVSNLTNRMNHEKLLLTSISYKSSDGNMSLSLCSTRDLPFMNNR